MHQLYPLVHTLLSFRQMIGSRRLIFFVMPIKAVKLKRKFCWWQVNIQLLVVIKYTPVILHHNAIISHPNEIIQFTFTGRIGHLLGALLTAISTKMIWCNLLERSMYATYYRNRLIYANIFGLGIVISVTVNNLGLLNKLLSCHSAFWRTVNLSTRRAFSAA